MSATAVSVLVTEANRSGVSMVSGAAVESAFHWPVATISPSRTTANARPGMVRSRPSACSEADNCSFGFGAARAWPTIKSSPNTHELKNFTLESCPVRRWPGFYRGGAAHPVWLYSTVRGDTQQ
jgi:hypothetical protein